MNSLWHGVHFEIYTDDPEAVQPFYKSVFGWKTQKWDSPLPEFGRWRADFRRINTIEVIAFSS